VDHVIYRVRQVIEALQQTTRVIEPLCFLCIVGSRHLSQQYNRM
jgi:hypothetical protein